jgi:hypothetical protein
VNESIDPRVVSRRRTWEDCASFKMNTVNQETSSMPLSEEENRILKQIEEQFYTDDPKFAQQVGAASLYRHAMRRVRWGVVGVVAGLAFLVATLQIHFMVAFLGFLLMLVSAFVIERNARIVGRIGVQDLAGVFKHRAAAAPRLRERFRRD